METYKNIPKLSTIERIAEALDVSVLDLFKEYPDNKGDREEAGVSEKVKQEEARKQKIRE